MISDPEFKVVVLGLDHIGLPMAAVMARTVAGVFGIDVTPSVVEIDSTSPVGTTERVRDPLAELRPDPLRLAS